MTSSQDFWARKLGKQNPQQPVQRSDQPWWRTIPEQPQPQQNSEEQVVRGQPGQFVHLNDEIVIQLDANGEYRPRKASHLKRSGQCPECDSPNFGRGEDSSRAKRCFDCGYVEGRSISDANRPIGATNDAPAQRARQITRMNVVDNTGKAIGTTTAAAGAQPNNRGEISNASQAIGIINGV